MRKDCAFLGIEIAASQCSDRVVMLAEFDGGSEMDTTNRYAKLLRKLYPDCSSLWVGVGIVYDQGLSSLL